MRIYSPEEIARLQANPNVKMVTNNRLALTLEFREKIYTKWVQDPCIATIRQVLREGGINTTEKDQDFCDHLRGNFIRYGAPHRGKGVPVKNKIQREESNKLLLATGKFVKFGHGITFSREFEEVLKSKYPEQSIADGIRQAGIDPEMVGYQRIYSLERRLSGQCNQHSQRKDIYTEDEIILLQQHPYVKNVTHKMLTFREALYADGNVLANAGCTNLDILEIFEISADHLSFSTQTSVYYRMRNYKKEQFQRVDPWYENLTESQKETYIRIQVSRLEKLQQIVESNLDMLKEKLPGVNTYHRMRICQWLKNDVPKEKKGKWSAAGILKRIGISESNYYSLLNRADDIEKAERIREEKKLEEMALVRQVADYKGYKKGSRQIYMLMPVLTNYHMSRRKIMGLMQEMGIQCPVRAKNPARRASRKYLKDHVKSNLVRRRFRLYRPGQIFLTDVTYIKYNHSRKLAYGSALLDSVTGMVYEFNVSEFNDEELVKKTLQKMPDPDEAREKLTRILHSDQGVLYLSDEFQELLKEMGLEQSMSKRGNCWDNAPTESFFGHFKDEVEYKGYETLTELSDGLAQYRQYFNEERGQWTRNKMTPRQFEAYLDGMTEEQFKQWQDKETERYEEMKRRAAAQAIERSKTLGV